MNCERSQLLITGYLDGELNPEEQTELLAHLEHCPACEDELRQHRKLKEITGRMRFKEPEERIWEWYWANVYNRLERHVAWILLSLGAVLLLSYATYALLEEAFFDQGLSLVVRIGVVSVVVGFYALMASIIRERLAIRRSDRYEGIKR
jgi:predicted anti-sigma-YlaC factor YlaD